MNVLKLKKVLIRVPRTGTEGCPMLSASLPGEMVEDYTDPEIMYENFMNEVDMVIDGGIGGIVPSTVIDFTGPEPEAIRKGAGGWSE